MNPNAESRFCEFNEQFESRVLFMYLDQLGLVTTGMGNLIDAPRGGDGAASALRWTWYKPNGQVADHFAVIDEWRRVKAMQTAVRAPDRVTRFRLTAILHTTDGEIERVCAAVRAEQEVTVRHFLPGWDLLPEAPQLAVASLCWAIGPHGLHDYPKLCAAVSAGDFAAAADEVAIEHLLGLYARRNKATADVMRMGYAPLPAVLPSGR